MVIYMNFNDLFQYKDLDMFYCDIDTERERGVLINEDCMKVLKQIDDNSVDLTLTDIPYGCKWCCGSTLSKRG